MTRYKYHLIHTWLGNHYRKEKEKCETCGIDKNLQFALKHGLKAKRDRSCYFVLCQNCHFNYDLTNRCGLCGKRCRNKFCGKGCKVKNRRMIIRKKALANPKKFNLETICESCGKTFIRNYIGKKSRFCSTTCRVNAFYKRNNINPSWYTAQYKKSS